MPELDVLAQHVEYDDNGVITHAGVNLAGTYVLWASEKDDYKEYNTRRAEWESIYGTILD